MRRIIDCANVRAAAFTPDLPVAMQAPMRALKDQMALSELDDLDKLEHCFKTHIANRRRIANGHVHLLKLPTEILLEIGKLLQSAGPEPDAPGGVILTSTQKRLAPSGGREDLVCTRASTSTDLCPAALQAPYVAPRALLHVGVLQRVLLSVQGIQDRDQCTSRLVASWSALGRNHNRPRLG